MVVVSVIAGLISPFLQAPPTTSPPIDPRQCTGARRGEVCTEVGRAQLRSELGLRSIEDETGSGAETYRAYYLEGGGALPAIVFARRPGEGPAVEIASGRAVRMVAPVSLETWEEVQALGRIATRRVERAPASAPNTAGATVVDDVCMDGGAIFAEVGRPASGSWGVGENSSLSVSSCSDTPTTYFARRLVTLAELYFPECSRISPDVTPGGVYRLRACFSLSGDQMAAAEILNRTADDPRTIDSDSTERRRREWQRALGVTPWTRLTWAGQDVARNPGGGDAGGATDFLISRAAELPGLDFRPLAFEGVSANRVDVTGAATYRPDEPNAATRLANYRQTWERSPGQEWRVTTWTIDAFAPVR